MKSAALRFSKASGKDTEEKCLEVRSNLIHEWILVEVENSKKFNPSNSDLIVSVDSRKTSKFLNMIKVIGMVIVLFGDKVPSIIYCVEIKYDCAIHFSLTHANFSVSTDIGIFDSGLVGSSGSVLLFVFFYSGHPLCSYRY